MRAMVGTLGVIVILASASLQAQEWSGRFGGIHVGYSSVKPQFTQPIYAPGTVNPSVDGLTGGAMLGCRGRRIGFEAELGITDLRGTGPSEAGDGFTAFEALWVSRARLTLSRVTGNTLFFVAGGAAAMRLYVEDVYFDEPTSDSLTHDPTLSTLTGLTIGVGMERVIRERMSARVEAIYDRYGGEDLSTTPGGDRIEPTSTTFRAAVLFRF